MDIYNSFRVSNFVTDCVGIVLMVLILSFGRFARQSAESAEKAFYYCVQLDMLLCVADIIVFAVDGIPSDEARVVAYIFNTLQAMGLTTTCYMWAVFVFRKTGAYSLPGLAGISNKIFLIPLLIVYLFYIANFFTPVCFYITADGYYHRGTFGYLAAFIVDTLYLLGASFAGAIASHRLKKYQFFPVMFFVLFCFTGVMLQMLLFGLSLIYICSAIGLLGVYMELQNEKSYIDGLSGLYNRQYMTRYLRSQCCDYRRRGQDDGKDREKLAMLLLDVDYFKSINDNFGHQAGDQAIRDVGALLMKSMPQEAVCCRYGGDEFVVVLEIKQISEIEELIKVLQANRKEFNSRNINAYELHFSIGMAVFDPLNDTQDTLLKRLDENMYREKQKRHAARD